MLSSAEDHTAGRDLLLRGTGRGEVLTAAQRRCKTMRSYWGHCVGDGYTALLKLFMKVHDHGSLLLCCMMLLMMMVVMMMSSLVYQTWGHSRGMKGSGLL